MYINSALVSAQNRQRFYAFNWGVEQPQDRGILLADILESGIPLREKSYALTKCYCNKGDGEGSIQSELFPSNPCKQKQNYVAEPVRIGTIKSGTGTHYDSKPFRVYSPYGKSVTLQGEAGGAGAKTGLYAIPINTTPDGKSQTLKAQYAFTSVQNICCYKSTYGASGVATATDEQPTPFIGSGKDRESIKRVYEVRNGEIEIKGCMHPINLPDGFYHIRKLTVAECCRLQTLPDDYCNAVSNAQAYKGLGNGWTAQVIIHLLNGAFQNVSRNDEIVCLSMYDGIGTGRYCLDKMGFTNVKYFAYEIDKFARKVANSNYPDIIQCGDAFDLRRDDWKIGGTK